MRMKEPFLTQFRELVRRGAGAADIHGQQVPHATNDAFVDREVGRAAQHTRYLIPLLRHMKPQRILDVGCSTGGTTAALAAAFDADVVGVDVSPIAVEAAQLQLQGLGLAKARAMQIDPTAPLPFTDHEFDLVVCVSVLEFVPSAEQRAHLLAQIARCSRKHVYLSTPSPYALRELHTGRILGNQRRVATAPWASSRRWIERHMNGFERAPLPRKLSRWQKLMFCRRA